MIAEALKMIKDTIEEAASPKKIESGDPNTLAYVVKGAVVERVVRPRPRDHRVGNLAEMIALANRFTQGIRSPAIWYDSDQVVLVIDDEDDGDDGRRQELATLKLETSDVFARIVALRRNPGAAWMEQKAFERLLRLDLAGTLDPGVLLPQVRRITWSNGSKAVVAVGRQAESLGREIVSKADTDGKDLPESVRLMAPVYKTMGERERYAVTCSVEIEPAECKLQLLPLPDEIERVQQAAIASIGERLVAGLENGVPAYHGRP